MKTIFDRLISGTVVVRDKNAVKGGRGKSSAPGSMKQRAQRMRLSNVVTNYQLLKFFLQDAFESKPRDRNAYNVFMKANLKQTKVYLDKGESERKACVVAPYLISKGSLAPIGLCAAGDALVSSLCVPQGFEITKDTTSGEVAAALICANAGMCEGDVLTVVRPVQKGGLNGVLPGVELKFYEFELDSSAGYGFYSSMPGDLFRVCGGFIGTAPDIESGGLAYVLSRTRGCKTLVSTQFVVLTPNNVVYEAYSAERPATASPPALSEGEGAPCGVFSHAGSLENLEAEADEGRMKRGRLKGERIKKGRTQGSARTENGERNLFDGYGVSATRGGVLVYRYVSL